MTAQARSLTVLADSRKFKKMGLFRVCQLNEIDRLVTEVPPIDPLSQALGDAEVDVQIAVT